MAKWTKYLVQDHAHNAAEVELYTIPLYITIMTSIKNDNSEAFKIIRGVLVEEMMHLQIAANLCVALDTEPKFHFPTYELNVGFIKPGAVLNADLGPLDDKAIKTMLAIEKPEKVVNDHNANLGPDYPYSSISEMYDALFKGIQDVGADQFSWTTAGQQQHWATQGYPQIIKNKADAKEAIEAIKAQGEGREMPGDLQEPYKPSDFPVDPKYQMNNIAPVGAAGSPYEATPILHGQYSHYGRFLTIQQSALPDVYSGRIDPKHPINEALQNKFIAMIGALNPLWTSSILPHDVLWKTALDTMRNCATLARKCWQAGVVPTWFHLF